MPCVCSGELVSNHDPPGQCQPSRISGSLWLETRRLFAREGVTSLGPSLPLSPPLCLLPPTGDGLVCHRLALLWNCSVPLFCRRLAVCSGWLIFSLLLSHSLSCYVTLTPSDCPQGTQALSNASHSSPLAGGGCRHLGYLSAGSCF